MAPITDFLGFSAGDIITLSDIQTQKEFNKMTVDFTIIEIRKYVHPEGVFQYTGYIASYQADPEKDEQQIMLLIRRIGDDFDLHVYYLDSDGPSEEFEDLFEKEKDDLLDRFEVTLHFDDGDLEVTWDRQGQSDFGVECTSTCGTEPCCKTIAGYFTNDETKGNPYCFLEWTGDKIGGYIEMWYGCEIREDDLEMFHTKN